MYAGFLTMELRDSAIVLPCVCSNLFEISLFFSCLPLPIRRCA